MRESKVLRAAKRAKEDGYVYMSSVVKSVFSTAYHHVVKIDDIIESGKWIPAYRGQYGNWYGRFGQINRPEKCINKSLAICKYC